MSDLRSVGIEAMADAWARLEEGKDYEMSGVAWANLRAVAAVQLDALLGVLEEHADEWIEAEAVLHVTSVRPTGYWYWNRMNHPQLSRLLAVLREDT